MEFVVSRTKSTCRTKKSPREPACPAYSPSCFSCSWAGHVTRMEDICMPKTVFFSEFQEGKRNRGAPRKHYKDQLKRQLAQMGISHQSWQQEASDGDNWRSSVRRASYEFEAERHKAAKEKRRRQKEQAATLPSSSQTFVCPECGRGCASRIGLHSHQWACKNWPSKNPCPWGMSHHHHHQWVGPIAHVILKSVVLGNVAGTFAIAVAGMSLLLLADGPDKPPMSSESNKTG